MADCPVCGTPPPGGARFCPSCGAPLEFACPACGHSLPQGACFCPSCGAGIDAVAPGDETRGRTEERKVISVLFVDLVGFTALTERSDPEDLRLHLVDYHRHIRTEVERSGGRIEKLLGDGVLAVFGVPASHEDDPERAVRAALHIQEAITDLNEKQPPDVCLQARIAVTTGEAIVQLESAPDQERIVGDVVNTASRLQSEAPPGGVVVDTRTQAGARHGIDFTPLDPITTKGKSAPIPVWLATGTRSRFGVAVDEDMPAEFVGRHEELHLLMEAFDRMFAHPAPQLVTITGEPGVGKSRLLMEFGKAVDDRPEVVWWRQGRCLPYGEGVTFWALSEIVKAQAGILETESVSDARRKLDRAVSAIVDNPHDAEWIASRLGPLAGLDGQEVGREELFSAWLRFLEALAWRMPLVLVVEDLHWCDEPLMEFLRYVVESAVDAPILLVVTARPGLSAERPRWGIGIRDSITIGLSPLNRNDTTRLALAVADTPSLSAEDIRPVVDQSGGNPLYVIEFIRLAKEQEILGRLPGRLPLPDSLQALVAARLDLLTPSDKSLLMAASVIGKVFWPGALAYLRSMEPTDLRGRLRSLVQRELIRRVRQSSMQGEVEYAFTHSVTVDVAYGEILRADKARLHLEMARWLEATGGDRIGDIAEVLAHHYERALRFGAHAEDLAGRAFHAFMLAGNKTEPLDASRSAGHYRIAADLAPTTPQRAIALLRLADVLASVDPALARSVGTEARSAFEEAGDHEGIVEATSLLARIAWWQGDADTTDRLDSEAVDLAEELPPCRAQVHAILGRAGRLFLRGHHEEAIEKAEAGLGAADAIGSIEMRAMALEILGSARRHEGVPELEEARLLARTHNLTHTLFIASNNLADVLHYLGRTPEALDIIDETADLAKQRRMPAAEDWSRMTHAEILFPTGRWDELLELTERLLEQGHTAGQVRLGALAWKWFTIAMRGQSEEAGLAWKEILPAVRRIKDSQWVAPAAAAGAWMRLEAGDTDEGLELMDEFEKATDQSPERRAMMMHILAPALVHVGDLDRLGRLLDTANGQGPLLQGRLTFARGCLCEGEGRLEEALDHFEQAAGLTGDAGYVVDATLAHLGAARCLVNLGRTHEAASHLEAARQGAELMKATPMLEEISELERMAEAQVAGRASH